MTPSARGRERADSPISATAFYQPSLNASELPVVGLAATPRVERPTGGARHADGSLRVADIWTGTVLSRRRNRASRRGSRGSSRVLVSRRLTWYAVPVTTCLHDWCDQRDVDAAGDCFVDAHMSLREGLLSSISAGDRVGLSPWVLSGRDAELIIDAATAAASRCESLPRGAKRAYFNSLKASGCRFTEDVDFSETTFGGLTSFAGTCFLGDATFDNSVFEDNSSFMGVHFHGKVSFRNAQFGVREAMVPSWTDFKDVKFCCDETTFRGVLFHGEVSFAGAECKRITFRSCRSSDLILFGQDDHPSQFKVKTLTLVASEFSHIEIPESRARIEKLELDTAAVTGTFVIGDGTCPTISIQKSRTSGRVHLVVRGDFGKRAEFVLENTELGGQTEISLIRTNASVRQARFDGSLDMRLEHADASILDSLFRIRASIRGIGTDSSIQSLAECDASNLAFSGLYLGACRFGAVANLDKLQVDTDCQFARRRGRLHVADDDSTVTSAPDLRRLANVYRALRKGAEDRRDYQVADTFLVSELDARSRAARREAGVRGISEYLTLIVYRLCSGYGLKFGRAVGCLAIVVLLGALLFDVGGFDPQRSGSSAAFGSTLMYTAQSSMSLLRPLDGPGLSLGEQVLQFTLRIVGPILVGLAGLGLRSRVRR